jgi:hypothetical protein
MEENLLNELENITSIKYLDDVTNNNNLCSNDEQVCLAMCVEISSYIVVLG